MYKNISQRGGGSGIRVSRELTSKQKKVWMGAERLPPFCERRSLLPINVSRTSPGSMPENELRGKTHGLYESFLVGSVTSFQKQKVTGGLPRQIRCIQTTSLCP